MLIFAPMLGSRNKSATWKIKKGVNCYFVILALPSNLPWAQITLDKKEKLKRNSLSERLIPQFKNPRENGYKLWRSDFWDLFLYAWSIVFQATINQS